MQNCPTNNYNSFENKTFILSEFHTIPFSKTFLKKMRKRVCYNCFCIASLGIRHLAVTSQTQLHQRTILDRYLGDL